MSRERVQLQGVAKTLLVTLYLRACDAHARRPVLGDPYAADVVERIGYDFSAFDRVRATAPLVAARALRLDNWTREFLTAYPEGQVLHLGCGLDSRPLRLDRPDTSRWVDIDQPEVIELRRRLYDLPAEITTVAASVTELGWWDQVDPQRPTLLVAEGLLMYLPGEDVHALVDRALDRLPGGQLAFDGLASWVIPLSRHSDALRRAGMRFSWPLEDLVHRHRGLRLVDDASLMDLLARNPSIRTALRVAYTALAWMPPMRSALRLQRLQFGDRSG